MVIVTNFRGFPSQWTAVSGDSGYSRQAATAAEFQSFSDLPDALFVVNCDPRLTLALAAAKLRSLGRNPVPIIAVDMVLRAPETLFQRAMAAVKNQLFKQVDLYIHYFRDFRRYATTFGIPLERNIFVPFKPNLGDRHASLSADPDGEYVLCFGRSMRDFDTFFTAVERLPYPAAIASPDMEQLRAHHARFTRPLDQLPTSVSILEDDGSERSQINILRGSKLVVLPILKTSLVASGISTCLNAMLLGKCVVGSKGPGMSDIFEQEIIAVPPEDPSALAAAIQGAWEDNDLRLRTAHAGLQYALRIGGESDLYQRIIDQSVLWYRRRETSINA